LTATTHDEVASPEPNATLTRALRLGLAAAYLLFAHLASDRHDQVLAACALGAIVVLVLLRPLLLRRLRAWILLLALGAVAVALARAGYALLPLLLVPAAIIGVVAYAFARTLRTVPLITRMVVGLDATPAEDLSPELLSYTRTLTQAWAVLLGVLALLNLAFALLSVPDGVLASVGVASPLPIDQAHWSWFAGAFNLGIMVGFFLIEFTLRQRRFPGRYTSLLDFMRRMAQLGPAFWRDVAH
jgi:uncharacterized membrane protein